jgi:membrane-bound metal-dependent hydrolase YbcI (DUF457 family)
LSIASYDWNPRTIAVVTAAHWLPNLDVLLIWAKLKKADFHCTVTHTLLFAVVVSLVFLPFSIKYGLLVFIALVAHLLADLPCAVGEALFWPFSKRKFTLALWKDTGYWGWKTFKGSYAQLWPWMLEGGAFLFLFYRLWVVYSPQL